MKIDSAYLGMESERLYKSSKSARKGSFTSVGQGFDTENMWGSFENFLAGKDPEKSSKDDDKSVTISEPKEIEDAFGRLSQVRYPRTSVGRDSAQESFQKMRQLFVKNILELLFGRRMNKHRGENIETQMPQNTQTPQNMPIGGYELISVQAVREFEYSESEVCTFQTSGTVKTQDGREINVNLNLNMSRSFIASYSESYEHTALNVCDPLVINLDGNPTGINKDITLEFDLDCDGISESIHGLGAGSGFLALDINGDGLINDGSELFGPKSGDGFAALAGYDADHNGWIDENDEIFDKLRIWTKDENGNDILYTLREKNVGAMYLGNVETQFSLNDFDNSTLGYVRSTGLFLFESGEVGTLQHLDIAL